MKMDRDGDVVTVYLYVARPLGGETVLVIYAPNADMAQYQAEKTYENTGQMVQYVERYRTAITVNGIEYQPIKQIPRTEVPIVKHRLFVFTYEEMSGNLQFRPIYAMTLNHAVLVAFEWVNERPQFNYVNVKEQPEGIEIGNVFYPGEEMADVDESFPEFEPPKMHVSLYAMSINDFGEHIVPHPLYAPTTEDAWALANDFYDHIMAINQHYRKVERCERGFEIGDVFYPPEKEIWLSEWEQKRKR
jgi:hypothetical protein